MNVMSMICSGHWVGLNLSTKAIMMYKTVHGMTPEYLRSKFVSQDDITSYRLRNKLALPHAPYQLFKEKLLL